MSTLPLKDEYTLDGMERAGVIGNRPAIKPLTAKQFKAPNPSRPPETSGGGLILRPTPAVTRQGQRRGKPTPAA